MTRITRRSLVGALVGLTFAAAAGVGLAQVTVGSTHTQLTTTSTTDSQTSSTENATTTDREKETNTGDEAGGGDSGAGQEKMDVCHKTGSGKERTINIAAPAVPAHVTHGDSMGACATTAGTNVKTSAAATTTRSNGAHKPKKTKPRQASSQARSSGSTSHANSSHGRSSHGNSAHGGKTTKPQGGGGQSHRKVVDSHGAGGAKDQGK